MPEELERPPLAPIVAVVAAGIVGVFVLRWMLRAIVGGLKFALLCAVIAAVIYGVSRLRSGDDD
ncbi:MAG: hypothetical protein R2733_11940 [Acidimicrobiales bacterium]